MTGLAVRFAVLVVLFGVLSRSSSAQLGPPRPDSAQFASLDVVGKAEAKVGSSVRVRVRSSDGKLLVARDGGESGFVWLAPDSLSASDSTWFSLTSAASGAITIRDWRGRCLGNETPDPSQPLDFGNCAQRRIFAHPGVDAPDGFWLISPLGIIGPTKVSPMLIPRSPAPVWFRLEKSAVSATANNR